MSPYQSLKPIVMEVFGLTRDAIHIYVGFFAFMATLILWKNNNSRSKALIPGFLLSLMMEMMDIHDDPRPNLNYQLLLSCFHDLVNTNFIPVFLVLFFKNFKRKLAD